MNREKSVAITVLIMIGIVRFFACANESLRIVSNEYFTVKPVSVVTSIKQATGIKQSCIQFPNRQTH